MKYIILEKARSHKYIRRKGIPGRYSYIYKESEKVSGILNVLKNILKNVLELKKQGTFTKEQREHVRKKLKELGPKLKYFKTQKNRIAISKVLHRIRYELEEQSRPRFKTKDHKELSINMEHELIQLGYNKKDVKGLSLNEVKAIYWNAIRSGAAG